MKISESWLREWANPTVDQDRLSEQLTMLGLEVDGMESAGPNLEGFLVGRIIKAQPHPDADRLQLCKVDIGGDTILDIVCGAPNARDGLTVAVAPVGATMPGGMEIKATRIRGQASEGMLCSVAELELGTDSDGILELEEAAEPGMLLADWFGLPDTVLEIDLTPNRGDCLSILGVAREVAVINGLPFAPPQIKPLVPQHDAIVDVTIEAPDLCAGYASCCVFNVDPKALTPVWLSERLRRAGIRPISLPVDIGNLIMLELGQPMHAFDYDKLTGKLHVRHATQGECIATLDGGEVTLNAGTLVIADDNKPVAIAGMIGGEESSVTETTSRVVFEAACFTPASVAGQGRVYKIHTDSSHRFERGVDPKLYPRAIERASRLLAELGGGHVGPVVERAGESVWSGDRGISLKTESVKRLLGQTLEASEIQHILVALGMKVEATSDTTWQVQPPSWRYDIAMEADLIEEVARVHGYDQLHEYSTGTVLPEMSVPESQITEQEILDVLRQRGYSEAITYSFVEPELQSALVPEGPRIDLANPIAEQLAQMRETLWASLLPAWEYNRRRQYGDIRLYECGQRFVRDQNAENGIAHIDTLAGVIDGNAQPRHWDVKTRRIDFFDVKSDVEALLAMGRHKAGFVAEIHPALHPGRTAAIYSGDQRIGWIGQLAPVFSKRYKGGHLPYLFELDYEFVRTRPSVRYRDISEQPRVQRDLAVVVSKSVAAGDLVDAITALDEPQLQGVSIFDVFYPEGAEASSKSVALGLIFQDKASTLTDEAVDAILERMIATLELRYSARIRGA